MRLRPMAVTVIAVYQFFAAGFLVLVALLAVLVPGMKFGLPEQVITFTLTRHNLPPKSLIPIALPALAVYSASIGWGLWCLKAWARNLAVATSGMTVLLWLRALVFRQWAMGDQLFRDDLARNTVWGVILINAAIALSLVMYPDVTAAFGPDRE